MGRIFSGVQPTGNLHLGNWLGALSNWVRLQSEFEAFYCVVDLHALTQRPDPAALRDATREVALGVVAAGVDPERATLFVQSAVPEHVELAWVLTCLTPMGDLNRMTQFKDKSAQQPDNINAGLFTYPVLQTADIALYKADRVPVGEDQEQHLELARETLRRFNGLFGATFPEPQVVRSPAPRVLGVDGETKMSKSRNNELGLFEPAAAAWEKLRTAKTDPARQRRTDPGEPTKCNVFSYHRFFSPVAVQDEVAAGCRSAGLGCIDCKQKVAEHIEAVKAPIRARAEQLRAHPGRLDEILAAGADKARAVAARTMAEVRDRVGLPPPRGR